MESIIIIAPAGKHDELLTRFARAGSVITGSDGTLVVDDGESRVYWGVDDAIQNELEPDQLDWLKSEVENPIFYFLDYTDIELCRKVIEAIADDQNLMVDNDHGLVLRGNEFVRILRARPQWDWRRAPPQ